MKTIQQIPPSQPSPLEGEGGVGGKMIYFVCIRDCSDKNEFPFKFLKMVQIFDEPNKRINYYNLQPKLYGVKL
jgi:hypothetical protein